MAGKKSWWLHANREAQENAATLYEKGEARRKHGGEGNAVDHDPREKRLSGHREGGGEHAADLGRNPGTKKRKKGNVGLLFPPERTRFPGPQGGGKEAPCTKPQKKKKKRGGKPGRARNGRGTVATLSEKEILATEMGSGTEEKSKEDGRPTEASFRLERKKKATDEVPAGPTEAHHAQGKGGDFCCGKKKGNIGLAEKNHFRRKQGGRHEGPHGKGTLLISRRFRKKTSPKKKRPVRRRKEKNAFFGKKRPRPEKKRKVGMANGMQPEVKKERRIPLGGEKRGQKALDKRGREGPDRGRKGGPPKRGEGEKGGSGCPNFWRKRTHPPLRRKKGSRDAGP